MELFAEHYFESFVCIENQKAKWKQKKYKMVFWEKMCEQFQVNKKNFVWYNFVVHLWRMIEKKYSRLKHLVNNNKHKKKDFNCLNSF